MPVRTCDPKAIKLGKTEKLASALILPDGWRAMDSDSLGNATVLHIESMKCEMKLKVFRNYIRHQCWLTVVCIMICVMFKLIDFKNMSIVC